MTIIKNILHCAALPVLALSVATAKPVLENGGFENGLEGWSHNRAVSVATHEPAEGKQLAVLEAADDARARLHVEITGLETGKAYVVRYQSRRSTATDARVVVRDLATNRYLASQRPSDSEQWKPGALRFAAPAATVRLEVRVAGGKAEVDQFSIVAAD